MFNDEGEKIGTRYTVIYHGVYFWDDSEGVNFFHTDSWDKAIELYHCLDGDHDAEVILQDNMYDVDLSLGEWY